jgi:hypothetical protein
MHTQAEAAVLMTTSPPEFLTPAQLVERYGNRISVRTLANWRSAGVSPPYVKIGGTVLYNLRELEDWERKRTCTGTFQYTK